MNKEVAVAVSGGVDSAVLLCMALKYARRAVPYFVKSAFQPQFELDNAVKLCDDLHTRLTIIETDIFNCEEVVSNPPNRCYYCKKRIFTAVKERAKADGLSIIVDGTNASDNADDRPGMAALSELGILSPLRICSLDKKAVRKIAKEHSLFLQDTPSYSCLATRIPAGTAITEEMIELIEKAESIMFELGFCDFRVRWLDGSAKIELCARDMDILAGKRAELSKRLSPYFKNIFVDMKVRESE